MIFFVFAFLERVAACRILGVQGAVYHTTLKSVILLECFLIIGRSNVSLYFEYLLAIEFSTFTGGRDAGMILFFLKRLNEYIKSLTFQVNTRDIVLRFWCWIYHHSLFEATIQISRLYSCVFIIIFSLNRSNTCSAIHTDHSS